MSVTEKLYTATQVRAMDAYVIDECGVPGEILMQRAGRAMLDVLLENFPATQSLLVFCGAGNNGGDGYVLATLAAGKGLEVQICQLAESSKLKGAAAAACQVAEQQQVPMLAFDPGMELEADIIVDALLGTGLQRDVSGDYAEAIDVIRQSGLPVVSADIPSGLSADTGAVMGTAVQADLTVSFIALKAGLFTGQARDYTGMVVLDDLDVPGSTYGLDSSLARLQGWQQQKEQFLRLRRPCAHKGEFGHVLIVGGDHGFGGAVLMAAEAALNCGAGLVSVATRPEHVPAILARCPEVMAVGVASGQELEPHLEKPDLIVCGPGLGTRPWGEQLLQKVLAVGQPLVLDADALNILSAQRLKYDFSERFVTMTPHPGEAARLLCEDVSRVEQNRYAAIRKLADQYEADVVLKGAGSLVMEDGELFVCADGNPGMASGGMGDVLSGVVAALLVQGFADSPLLAAVVLHAYAADVVAGLEGERGLHASQLMPVLRELVNGEDGFVANDLFED